MLNTLTTVLKEARYALTAILIAVSVFVFAVWLPNISLILTVLTSEAGTFADKLSFLFSLLGSITTNFTVVSATSTILIAILFGVNVALLLYYIRKVQVKGGIRTLSGLGIAGLVSGFLGVGCAACGTFILSSSLVLIGVGGILTYLPLSGGELGFIGVALLGYSIYRIVKKIEAPNIC